MIQNMKRDTSSAELNPSLELLENLLFSIVLNHNPLGSVKAMNSNKTKNRQGSVAKSNQSLCAVC